MDPAYLLRAVRLLAKEAPAATTHAQTDLLRKEFFECASRAAIRFHTEYHRTTDGAECSSPPLLTLAFLLNHDANPRLAIRLWARRFIDDFSRTHPWPPAVHAAMVLRKQRRRWVPIEWLCSRLGVGKSTLARGFRQLYGISPSEYHRRARLAWAVSQLAGSDACVESIAIGAGYRSAGSLYESCWCLTGRTPAQIRQLAADDLRDLLDRPLSLAAGFTTSRGWPRTGAPLRAQNRPP